MRTLTTFILAGFTLVVVMSFAQTAPPPMRSMKPAKGTVCFGYGNDANTFVPPPKKYLDALRNSSVNRIQTATIKVTYIGFSSNPQAQTAFQAAVNIWQTLISSPVTINMTAVWQPLGATVLGSTTPYTYYTNFPNAQKANIWYPVALAEKIAGKELNPSTDPDIYASFSSTQTAWYYGTDGHPGSKQYDLMSVVLHEIGHGLGITHTYEVTSGTGDVMSAFGVPVIYETFAENQIGQNLVKSFQDPSSDLGSQITGGQLYFNSPLVLAGNGNVRGRLYAPADYTAGSSVAHLDEATYPAGNVNSLMTPVINPAEAIHDPGPIVKALLNDLGWNSVGIAHTPLPNTENVSQDFTVTCQVTGDSNFDASSLQLFYSTDAAHFTSVVMQPTGNPNEYSAIIPKPTTGTLTTYDYFISVNDVNTRTFSRPGLVWTQGSSSTPQLIFTFQSGPDNQPPKIVHIPTGFVKSTDTQLPLVAQISDNIGIQGAVVQYSINKVSQPDFAMTLTNTTDSTYSANIPLSVSSGDTIRYRIKATDSSVEANVADAPKTGDYIVNVVSLAATQTSYKNNFNTPSSDFFGDSFFSITSATGFKSNAIHSIHPYPNALALGKDSLNYVYQLRVPIKLKATGAATLVYREVALVEPGTTGVPWPSPDFFDYVIVEGSKDGGVTWNYLTKGYDCRSQTSWLTRWNSHVDSNGNSLAAGDSTLFATRTIDMTSSGFFKEGDVIVIRFRLFSDQLAYGWGWAIDDLKIQVDETPPAILHNLVDFVTTTATGFDLTVKATDASGVQNLSIDYSVNNQASTNFPFTITQGVDQYTLTINTLGSGLHAGDEIEYKINATDSVGNTTSLPTTGNFTVTMLNLKSSISSYTSDFNSANTDFAGNLFSVSTPTGFASGAIQSAHPYPNGFGLDNTSDFSYILKTPIKIATSNAKIFFNEIAIIETSTGNTKDYASVEGSKDGVTWFPFVAHYSASANQNWQSAYFASANGTPSLYAARVIDMTQSGNFHAGDSVLIRFRLHADANTNAWGWAIDDLSIQGPITGVEKTEDELTIYPNPVTSNYFSVSNPWSTPTSLTIVDILGRQVASRSLAEMTEQSVFVGDIGDGLYIVRVASAQGLLTKKIIIKR